MELHDDDYERHCFEKIRNLGVAESVEEGKAASLGSKGALASRIGNLYANRLQTVISGLQVWKRAIAQKRFASVE